MTSKSVITVEAKPETGLIDFKTQDDIIAKMDAK